jgi:probable phosphoglycerate mutase
VPLTDDVVPLAADAPPSKLVGWGHDLGVPTTFVLVRHGERAHSREKRFSGSGGIDPPLSADGRAQAAAVAAALGARGDVDAVVSSPLRRARETADLVGTVLGLDVVVDGDLAECAFGEWEGLTFAEVEERYPDELAAWLGSPAVAPPGGESFDSVERRVRAARDRLLVAYEGRTVVVVSHVTPVKTLVRLALDAPPRALHRMELAPAAMTTVLWFSDGNASLRSYNDVFHLDGLLPVHHV